MPFSKETQEKARQAREDNKAKATAALAELDEMKRRYAEQQRQIDALLDIASKQSTTVPPKTDPIKTEEPVKDPDDDHLVTVLYGYPNVRSTYRQWVDNVEFRGGVAKGVPMSVAKHWVKGTRPGGGTVQGRIKVTILADDATPADYAVAVGMPPFAAEKVAAMLQATDLDHLCAAMGEEDVDKLVRQLQARVARSAKKS